MAEINALTAPEATPKMQRARQPKQKEQRRDAILQAALALYLQGNGQLPKMDAVAKQVQLPKVPPIFTSAAKKRFTRPYWSNS